MQSSHTPLPTQQSDQQPLPQNCLPRDNIRRTPAPHSRSYKLQHLKQRNVKVNNQDDIESQWEKHVLQQLAQELYEKGSGVDLNGIEYQGDKIARPVKSGISVVDKLKKEGRKKGMDKFKAYAVKMKIPSYGQMRRTPASMNEQWRASTAVNINRPPQRNRLDWVGDLCQPKLFTLEKTSQKHIQSRQTKTSLQNRKHPSIRRRSILPKKKDEDLYNTSKQMAQPHNRTGTAEPNRDNKKRFNSIINHKEQEYWVSDRQEHASRPKWESTTSQLVKKISRYQPDKDRESHGGESRKRGSQLDSPDYLEKGISFKNRSIVVQSNIIEEKECRLSAQKKFREQLLEKADGQIEPPHFTETMPQLQKHPELSPQHQPEPPSPMKTQPKYVRHPSKYSSSISKLSPYCNPDNDPPKHFKTYLSKDMRKPSASPEKMVVKKESATGKVLIFNSEDKYVRSLLIGLSWVTNPDLRSKYYHLKWIFKPIPEDYNNLGEGQYINHIKNSHQLTSKNCLNRNLNNYRHILPKLDNFYPKCYDLSKNIEREEFQAEYVKQFMMRLLINIYKYLLSKREEEVLKYRQFYVELLEEDGGYRGSGKYISPLRKKQFKAIDLEDYKYHDQELTLHLNLLVVALRYYRWLRKADELDQDDHYHFLAYSQKQKQNHIDSLEEYSQMSPNYSSTDLSSQVFIRQYYATPTHATIERIVKEYVYFEHKYKHQWAAYGHNNIWIIKPSSASRGNGISLQNNSRDIMGINKGVQTRIVQKYIQRPMMLNGGGVGGRKFDIRQWVLLRCVNPLQIYMFSHCYVRLCSEPYSLNSISNLRSHLTNYSFNKGNFKHRAQSVLSYDTFVSLLRTQKGINYEQTLKPKIQQIIINSIKTAQDQLNDYNKRCFSLLGYDILLDQQGEPWLLEVNMSPACQERTSWLKEYLRVMGEGMMGIVLPKEYMKKYVKKQEEGEMVQKVSRLDLATPRSKQLQRANSSRSHIQLHRIRTEMSQEHLSKQGQKDKLPRRQSTLVKIQDDPLLNQVDNEGSQEYSQIDYDRFLQQLVEGNGKQQGSDECLEQSGEKQLHSTLPIPNIDEGINSQLLYSQGHCFDNRNIPKHPEPQTLQIPSSAYISAYPLQWQQICYEEYSLPTFKKQQQKQQQNIQIVGSKISSAAVKANDVRLDQYEETRQYVYESVVKLQRKIKSYIGKRKAKKRNVEEETMKEVKQNVQENIGEEVISVKTVKQSIEEEKQMPELFGQKITHSEQLLPTPQQPSSSTIPLRSNHQHVIDRHYRYSNKITFSRIGRNLSEKNASSIFFQEEPQEQSTCQHNKSSIWHYNCLHTYQEPACETVKAQIAEVVEKNDKQWQQVIQESPRMSRMLAESKALKSKDSLRPKIKSYLLAEKEQGESLVQYQPELEQIVLEDKRVTQSKEQIQEEPLLNQEQLLERKESVWQRVVIRGDQANNSQLIPSTYILPLDEDTDLSFLPEQSPIQQPIYNN